MKLHIDADVVRQPTGEELSLLEWRQMARVRHTGLERLHVGVHRGREGQSRQVRQMVGA